MLDDRKSAILRAVVKEYIETGEPVGSTHLARAAHLGVSPATVRNEMAVLEREGFLTQPHTSAGRVPSDKGYRFYVDQLRRPPAPLTPPQTHQVREFFARAHGELEQMLHETSDLLSSLTHYAALVVASPHDGATVRSVHLVSMGPRTALVVAVLSSGVVEKATVEIDPDTGVDRVAAASALLAGHLTGRVLEDVSVVPDTGDASTDRVVRAAHQALREHCDRMAEHVFVGGASRMAATFDAVDTVRQVLTLLEEQYVVVGLLRAALTDHEGLNVAIGAEHGVESLADCSLVVAPYLAGGATAGSIAVLGPTRMKYPQAMAVVNAVSERLGRLLTEG